MKTKHAIYVLACGFILVFGGAILKLMNFNNASIVIIFGMVVQAIGVILLIIKLTNHPKIKDLMNS
jgi:hypothetical protein